MKTKIEILNYLKIKLLAYYELHKLQNYAFNTEIVLVESIIKDIENEHR